MPCGCPQACDSPWLALWGWGCIPPWQVRPLPPRPHTLPLTVNSQVRCLQRWGRRDLSSLHPDGPTRIPGPKAGTQPPGHPPGLRAPGVGPGLWPGPPVLKPQGALCLTEDSDWLASGFSCGVCSCFWSKARDRRPRDGVPHEKLRVPGERMSEKLDAFSTCQVSRLIQCLNMAFTPLFSQSPQ